MGDRVAVMRDGVLQQVDSPLALYDTPKNLFVAGFIGSPAMNLMEGYVVDGGVKLGDYVVPISRDVLAKAPNETKLTLGIRPEAFTLASEGIGLDVAVVEELGADAYLYGSLVGSGKQASIEDGEAHQVVARISSRRPPRRGEQVRLGVDPASVHVFSQETTERISCPSMNATRPPVCPWASSCFMGSDHSLLGSTLETTMSTLPGVRPDWVMAVETR